MAAEPKVGASELSACEDSSVTLGIFPSDYGTGDAEIGVDE